MKKKGKKKGKIVLGNHVHKKKGWGYNPKMKRWVKGKKSGKGFLIKAYRRKKK